MVLAHALNVVSPTPAGHDVCTFHTVVCAAWALPMNGPLASAAPRTPVLALRKDRRVARRARAMKTLGRRQLGHGERQPLHALAAEVDLHAGVRSGALGVDHHPR